MTNAQYQRIGVVGLLLAQPGWHGLLTAAVHLPSVPAVLQSHGGADGWVKLPVHADADIRLGGVCDTDDGVFIIIIEISAINPELSGLGALPDDIHRHFIADPVCKGKVPEIRVFSQHHIAARLIAVSLLRTQSKLAGHAGFPAFTPAEFEGLGGSALGVVVASFELVIPVVIENRLLGRQRHSSLRSAPDFDD